MPRASVTKKAVLPKKETKKKAAPQKVKVSKASSSKISEVKKTGGLEVTVYDITGKSTGSLILPKDIFGVKPNLTLLAQAMRVYRSNRKPKTAFTKTRGEVRGGGVKPWRQKGTGRARAGSNRSPLWVGGGTVFGPRPGAKKLELPKKMKRKALTGALSDKAHSGKIKVISGLEKLPPKTKGAASLLKKLDTTGASILILDVDRENVKLATRNIPELSLNTIGNLNAYGVMLAKNLIFAKEAIEKLK